MSKVTETNGPIHGYKVFYPDWTSRPNEMAISKQYSCPGKFVEMGHLDLSEHGMHFCTRLSDCFSYYSFNPENKVAEVVAYGKVITDGNKSCTNKLKIIRELSWEEVLHLVNMGDLCTGFENTGALNSGNRNAGNGNSGSYNCGHRNSGDFNTGNNNFGSNNTGGQNIGSGNVGSYNVGTGNTGYENSGNYNSGRKNTGSYNSGSKNSGKYNSGNNNIGSKNSGDHNFGDRNAGDWNQSSNNSGCFNVKEHKIMMFDKPSNITYEDWLCSDARYLLNQMPGFNVDWVFEVDMSQKEKDRHPSYKTAGGFLKIQDDCSRVQYWWDNLSDTEKDTIKAIPNFDPDIFYECTGIRVGVLKTDVSDNNEPVVENSDSENTDRCETLKRIPDYLMLIDKMPVYNSRHRKQRGIDGIKKIMRDLKYDEEDIDAVDERFCEGFEIARQIATDMLSERYHECAKTN